MKRLDGWLLLMMLGCVVLCPAGGRAAAEVQVEGATQQGATQQGATQQGAVQQGAVLALPAGVQGQLDRFFNLVGEHKLDLAYDGLLKGTSIEQRPPAVEALKAKTQQAISMFGDIAGYDVIDVKYAGKHLLQTTCLSLSRDFPLRWRFYFYNQERSDGWLLLDIRVDDQLAEIFGEQPARNSGVGSGKAAAGGAKEP